MPFLRYTRDRRGYETTYLMHGYRSAQGPGRTRVLYLFRSPAHVKVGRRALDDEAREALEHTHPDLSFDWAALAREPAPHHFEERDRQTRNGRGRSPQRPQPSRTPPPPVAEDSSVLGRALGGAEAARLRERYGDLMQRIARRAPTPEERDRLTERVQRLNPDDWADEAAVGAGVQTIEAGWDAIRRELPSRRWGSRRGGDRGPSPGSAPSEPSPDQSEAAREAAGEASAIIERRSGEANAGEDDRQAAGADNRASAPGDGDPVGGGSSASTGDRLPGGD